MIIGVFDSGIGGQAIAISLQTAFPQATIRRVSDSANVPYGDKTARQILQLTDAAIQPLLGADVIVLACNSATTAAITPLRERYPTQKFIGIEPMIKTAARYTKSGIIAVCATPATLVSARYHNLVATYAKHRTLIEPDCSEWAYMIETNQINAQHIHDTVEKVCQQGADVIVLACTHYLWIKGIITKIANDRAIILEPSEAISHRVKTLLSPS
jgi:glutamate racemase